MGSNDAILVEGTLRSDGGALTAVVSAEKPRRGPVQQPAGRAGTTAAADTADPPIIVPNPMPSRQSSQWHHTGASTRCFCFTAAAVMIIAMAVLQLAPTATGLLDASATAPAPAARDGEQMAAAAVSSSTVPTSLAASLARPLVFQHVQKTGGSTIRKILHDAFAAQGRPVVIPCFGEDSCFLNLLWMLSSPNNLNRTACAVAFAGHFPSGALGLVSHLAQIDLGLVGPVACRRWPWLERSGVVVGAAMSAQPNGWLRAMLRLLGTNTACALMVREPLARLQSHYYHFVEPAFTGGTTKNRVQRHLPRWQPRRGWRRGHCRVALTTPKGGFGILADHCSRFGGRK